MKYLNKLTTVLILSTLFGLILFFRGLFIDRRYLRDKAKGESVKQPPVVLLVIDSFRIDLALDEHFQFIQQHKKSNQSLLFLSMAEAPTVTGPRIQTMTTGNFAPLTKVLDNFHDSEIVEDSIMHQAKMHSKKTLFIGDNNWLGLYPNQFTFAYPLHNMHINTEKMYQADKQFEKIFHSNSQKEFDLTVIHFLGIDFVAHEYNRVQHNKVLEDQLEQLSKIIDRIYSSISNETTLIITGDHGMENDGNHGGNSSEETNTVFFVTRKNGFTNRSNMEIVADVDSQYQYQVNQDQFIRKINQIDIAPTLAILLGVPIPFSNIGILIPELFENNQVQQHCLNNLNQMFEYVTTIHQAQNHFSSSQLTQWKTLISEVHNCTTAIPLMKTIQDQSRSIWSQYNDTLILLSMIYQSLTFILYIVCVLSVVKIKEDFIDIGLMKGKFKALTKKYSYHIAVIAVSSFLTWFIYGIEILIALLLIVLTTGILFYSIKRLFQVFNEGHNIYFSVSKEAQHHRSEFLYITLFLLVIFTHKVYRQASLIFSIDSQRIELDNLFDQFLDMVVISLVLNLFLFLKRYFETEQTKYNLTQIGKKLGMQLIFGVLVFLLISLEYYFYSLSEKHSFKKMRRYQQLLILYIPSAIQHILLYYYMQQQEKSKLDKIFGHCYLFILQMYFILPQFKFFQNYRSQQFTQYWLNTIFGLMLYYLYSKDFVFLFIPSMIATSQYGIAIYTIFFLLMIILYQLFKNQLQYNKLVFLGLISILCQYTWFMVGNRCTISAVQNAASRLGFSTTNVIETPLLLFLMLAGPYIAGCVFLKFFTTLLQKQETNDSQDLTKEIKLLFLSNFYIQIFFTQIHNYHNLGGATKIQFKYIFDVLGYMIISLLVSLY